MRYVKSKLPNSCVVACLAMIVGKTFDQTLKGLREYWDETGQFEGVGDEIFSAYLAQEGYAIRYMHHEYEPRVKLRSHWPPRPFAPIHCCDVFASADRLGEGGMHAVVMLADGAIIDPNDRKARTLSDYYRVIGVCGIYKVGEPFPDP